ncbi:MAG: glycosyltransferase, partial [Proteobacteria bacterium]|nr:glycosyltransferase [Pseudomonadota bacterium]
MISVIIPTLNEGANLPRLLATLSAEPTASEIIVADGGSDDDTGAIARAAGVK